MSTLQVAFLTLLALGLAAMLAGTGLTRFHWRSGIPPYSVRTRFLDVAFHPERYAAGAPLRTIRSLNIAGAISIVAALGIAVYEIVCAVIRQ